MATCPHRNPDTQQCGLILAELQSHTGRYLCSPHHEKVCGECQCPFTWNYVSAALLLHSARPLLPPEKHRELSDRYLHIAYSGSECNLDPLHHFGEGVGTELHRILEGWGWKISLDCPCLRHIAEMNKSGPNWVLDNLDTIGSWLVEEFNRRHPALAQIPFARILTIDVAVRLVRRAVERYNLKST